MEKLAKKEIIVVYSYRGGTTRSSMVANLASIGAKKNRDMNILVIDWDWQAPGVDVFFERYRDGEDEKTEGLIDFLRYLKQELPSGTYQNNKDKIRKHFTPDILKKYCIPIKLKQEEEIIKRSGAFDLMPSWTSGDFVNKAREWNWEAMEEKIPWFMDVFAESLLEHYHLIIIDSPNAAHHASEICTMTLARTLVIPFTPNKQNLRGLKRFIPTIFKQRENRKTLLERQKADGILAQHPQSCQEYEKYQKLKLFPVPTRFDVSEQEKYRAWERGTPKTKGKKKIEGYRPAFEKIFNEVHRIDNCNLEKYFENYFIRHVPFLSFGDDIAFLDLPVQKLGDPPDRYEALYELITGNKQPWEIQNEKEASWEFKSDQTNYSTLTNSLSNITQGVKKTHFWLVILSLSLGASIAGAFVLYFNLQNSNSINKRLTIDNQTLVSENVELLEEQNYLDHFYKYDEYLANKEKALILKNFSKNPDLSFFEQFHWTLASIKLHPTVEAINRFSELDKNLHDSILLFNDALEIYDFAFSANGKFVASIISKINPLNDTEEQQLLVQETVRGTIVYSTSFLKPLNKLSLDSQGIKIVVLSIDNKSTIDLLNSQTKTENTIVESFTTISQMALSPSGNYLVYAQEDKVTILDTRNPDVKEELFLEGIINHVLFHPEEKHLLFSTVQGNIKILTKTSSFRIPFIESQRLNFSLLTEIPSWDAGKKIKNIHFDTKEDQIKIVADRLYTLAFESNEKLLDQNFGENEELWQLSNDGNYLLSHNLDNSIFIKNIENKTVYVKLEVKNSPKPRVLMGPFARKLIVNPTKKSLDLYPNLDNANHITLDPQIKQVVTFSPFAGDQSVAILGKNKNDTLQFWNQNFETTEAYESTDFPDGNSIQWMPDGKSFITNHSTETQLWNWPNFEDKVIIPHPHSEPHFSINAQGTLVAISTPIESKYKINLLSLSTKEVQSTEIELDSQTNALQFSPKGNYLAIGDNNHNLKLFEIDTGRELNSWENDSNHQVIRFSPSGKYISTLDVQGSLNIYDTGINHKIWMKKKIEPIPEDFAFRGEGYLATADLQQIRIWDIHWKEKIGELPYDLKMNKVKFTHDGKQLITWGQNNMISFRQWYPNDLIKQACSKLSHIGNTDLLTNDSLIPEGIEITDQTLETCPY